MGNFVEPSGRTLVPKYEYQTNYEKGLDFSATVLDYTHIYIKFQNDSKSLVSTHNFSIDKLVILYH